MENNQEIQIQFVPIELLEYNEGQIPGVPENPRTREDAKQRNLEKSIEELPEMTIARAALCFPYKGRYVVIGGNRRLEAQRVLKRKEVPIISLPENTPVEKLRRIALLDNESTGQTNWTKLAKEWNKDEIKAWKIETPKGWFNEAPGKKAEEDNYTEPEKLKLRVKPGEIWQLGEHRLMCGDSTDEKNFELLMNGEKADIAFTSPPYNLMEGFNTNDKQADGYLRGENAYNEYSDDRTPNDYAQFLTDVLSNCLNNTDDVFFNIGYTKGALVGTAKFIGQNADYFCGAITWVKSGCYMPFFPVQHGMLGNITEPVYIFTKKSGRKLHHPQWKQGETSYNIVETKNATGNDYSKEHAATFPIEFAYEVIKRFSDTSVLDCFGGTGTTLMAAEQLGRKCYMIELDPYYCDIIINRWEKLTGHKAVKIG